ncbi:hypothetical protein LCGC14_0199920 [marine sediment metagenome]|uniref:Uncharacterized protein n=2 Tax=root TaxID=1 RepID=A0A0F9X3I4_9ZZZZ|nr:hypothetical protein [Maribacter sp.]
MKSKVLIKTMIFLSISMMMSCSNGQENEDVDLNALCIEPDILIELTEAIPAKVRVVEDGQPFFNGIKTYYEVDAETHLPLLFEINGEKTIRIFPVKKIKSDEGSDVEITGKLISCLTGAHGLVTNDYKGFTLLEE